MTRADMVTGSSDRLQTSGHAKRVGTGQWRWRRTTPTAVVRRASVSRPRLGRFQPSVSKRRSSWTAPEPCSSHFPSSVSKSRRLLVAAFRQLRRTCSRRLMECIGSPRTRTLRGSGGCWIPGNLESGLPSIRWATTWGPGIRLLRMSMRRGVASRINGETWSRSLSLLETWPFFPFSAW